jgi:hypothetical protein
MNYFKAVRAAFEDRSIRRGIIVADGEFVACQTWIEGTFVREFTQSPAGALPPNGKRIVWDLMNIFRFDDHGRLVEEGGCERITGVFADSSELRGSEELKHVPFAMGWAPAETTPIASA